MVSIVVPFRPLKKRSSPRHVVVEEVSIHRALIAWIAIAFAVLSGMCALLFYNRIQVLEREVRVLQIEKSVLLHEQSMCKSEFTPQKPGLGRI